MENLGCHILEGPQSHGSRTMVNSFIDCAVERGKGRIGRKVRRNEASELRDLIVRAIMNDGLRRLERGRVSKLGRETVERFNRGS
jgi:hypothetical protein